MCITHFYSHSCSHTTQALKYSVASHCQDVQDQLEFYHTQPERLPEPNPLPMPTACIPKPISYMSTVVDQNGQETKPVVWDTWEVMEWQKVDENIMIHNLAFGCGRNLGPHCNIGWRLMRCPFVKPVQMKNTDISKFQIKPTWVEGDKTSGEASGNKLHVMEECDMGKIKGKEAQATDNCKRVVKEQDHGRLNEADNRVEYWGYFCANEKQSKNDTGNGAMQTTSKGVDERNTSVSMIRSGQCILDGAAEGELLA